MATPRINPRAGRSNFHREMTTWSRSRACSMRRSVLESSAPGFPRSRRGSFMPSACAWPSDPSVRFTGRRGSSSTQSKKRSSKSSWLKSWPRPRPGPFTVPVYFDYQSQNSWLAVPVCETLSQKYAVEFSWRAFQQRPEWKPLDRAPAPKEVMAWRWDQSRAVGKILGLELAKTRPPIRFNTRRLHMCTEYARLQGLETALIKALLEAMPRATCGHRRPAGPGSHRRGGGAQRRGDG